MQGDYVVYDWWFDPAVRTITQNLNLFSVSYVCVMVGTWKTVEEKNCLLWALSLRNLGLSFQESYCKERLQPGFFTLWQQTRKHRVWTRTKGRINLERSPPTTHFYQAEARTPLLKAPQSSKRHCKLKVGKAEVRRSFTFKLCKCLNLVSVSVLSASSSLSFPKHMKEDNRN